MKELLATVTWILFGAKKWCKNYFSLLFYFPVSYSKNYNDPTYFEFDQFERFFFIIDNNQ